MAFPADKTVLDPLGPRLRALPVLKTIALTSMIGAFFVGYFFTLKHPIFPARTMPVIFVDRWIGFHPAALGLYLTLWIYLSWAPALIADPGELGRYCVAAVAVGAAGLGIFLLFPTAVPPSGVD